MLEILKSETYIKVPMELCKFLGNENEAMLLQFILEEGKGDWFYISIADMAKLLPISVSTLKRVIKKLEGKEYLYSSTQGNRRFDATKSYTVNVHKIRKEFKEWSGNEVS